MFIDSIKFKLFQKNCFRKLSYILFYNFSRMTELLSTHFDFSAPSYLSSYFIIEKHKQRQIIGMDIKLAEGYSFLELDPKVCLFLLNNLIKFKFMLFLLNLSLSLTKEITTIVLPMLFFLFSSDMLIR